MIQKICNEKNYETLLFSILTLYFNILLVKLRFFYITFIELRRSCSRLFYCFPEYYIDYSIGLDLRLNPEEPKHRLYSYNT